MSDWFFTSDLHGQGALYEQLVALVAVRRPRVAILGGDLAPHATGDAGVAQQRVFLRGTLVEFARRVREASPATELLVMMGNDDWSANMDCLEERHGDLWQVVHGRAVTIDGIGVAGMSWVPITPFTMKDWDRWEDGAEERPARLDGWVSRGDRLVPHRFDPADRTPTIADALDTLAAAAPVGESVIVAHSPPRGTNCDTIGRGVHVGSRALRAFLERHQPPLVLSGHIHEAPRVSDSWRDAIGRTITVNPGQFGTPTLCGVWFDPKRPGETLRHTVHEIVR